MRRVESTNLWIGHVGEARDARELASAEIAALVELAVNEEPVRAGREMVHGRFPLMDGRGNAAWILRGAIGTVEGLVRANVCSLVFCGAGMSRAPSVAAGGLALAEGRTPEECLLRVVRDSPADVSPGLWADVCDVVAAIRAERGTCTLPG